MEHLGIDVHKVAGLICILTESGEVIERRIRTQRERFAAVLGERPRAKVLIEASTESEWVARCLEELGHEVVWRTRTSPPCTRPGAARGRPTCGTRGRWPRRGSRER